VCSGEDVAVVDDAAATLARRSVAEVELYQALPRPRVLARLDAAHDPTTHRRLQRGLDGRRTARSPGYRERQCAENYNK